MSVAYLFDGLGKRAAFVNGGKVLGQKYNRSRSRTVKADPVAACGCIIGMATSGTEESLESSPRSFGCDRNLCPGRPDRLAPSDKEGS